MPKRKTNRQLKEKYFPNGCDVCTATIGDIRIANDKTIYGRRWSKSKKKYWLCEKCKSYVGCHKVGRRPYGALANKEVRKLRKQAHEVFDAIWQYYIYSGRKTHKDARNSAYGWLASQMNLSKENCHIGKFNEENCRRVIEICLFAYMKSKKLKRFYNYHRIK